jgi:DNA-binding HxlR family transcriptional regulator
MPPMVRRWSAKILELSDAKILIYLYEKKNRNGATITFAELGRVLKYPSTLRGSLRSLLDYGLIEKKTKSDSGTVDVVYALSPKGRNFSMHLLAIQNLLKDPTWE